MQYFDFHGAKLSKIFKGNWQLSGGMGDVNIHQAIDDLFEFVEHGINVFDVGDIYTNAEDIVGSFTKRYKAIHGPEKYDKLRVFTKFVPDLNALDDLTKKDIRYIIERSMQRLGVEKLNLVQFHWWDFSKGDYIKAAQYLEELREIGLIEHIGLTNFDCEHLTKLLDAGVKVQSNQIQFSLLDPRPFNGMLELAKEKNIALFCYGTLAGGLLGYANPMYDPTNRSHVKYKLIIDEVGHDYYDGVLELVKKLAATYDTTIANIATRFILETDGVSSAILGPRNDKHLSEVDKLFDFEFKDSDYKKLMDMVKAKLPDIKGDIYSYERNIEGPHGRIMKYNLNNMRMK